MIPVILSGGSGTRLWPVSRQQMPKQFCYIFEKPLQTMTLERCHQIGKPWIVTSRALQTLTDLNLKDTGFMDVRVVYEPMGKNTAPAVAVLCQLLLLEGKQDEVVGVFPSDHLISKEQEFLNVVALAEKMAADDRVVTLGITPSYPETGYGYIQTQPQALAIEKGLHVFPVVKFHEKPALEKAQEFLAKGGFSWNAGIFVFKVSHMVQLFQKWEPEIWGLVSQLKKDLSNLDKIYAEVKSISVDYAIMERLTGEELCCIPADFGWSDVGSWDAVASLEPGQEIVSVQSKGNFVFGDSEKCYSMIGLDDVIVVDTRDALMVVKKGQSQNVRHIVEALTQKGSSMVKEHHFEYRPWGYFEILMDTDHFKSKVIRVNAHSQISYQSHSKREEHWTITKGSGEVVLNDKIIPVAVGSHVHIPLGAKHRIRNNTDSVLEFVEVQVGTYFGEDDIVRYQDDYKRLT